jgi:hypothetical protein
VVQVIAGLEGLSLHDYYLKDSLKEQRNRVSIARRIAGRGADFKDAGGCQSSHVRLLPYLAVARCEYGEAACLDNGWFPDTVYIKT